MSTNISLVNFNDQIIVAIEHEGQQYVAMRNIVENLGIDWKSQYTKLKNHPILGSTVVLITTVAEDGKLREAVCLPLKMLNGWLLSIDPRKVREALRERLIRYQSECFDVLYRYFSGQSALTQRTSTYRDSLLRLRLMERLACTINPTFRQTLIDELCQITVRLGLPMPDYTAIKPTKNEQGQLFE